MSCGQIAREANSGASISSVRRRSISSATAVSNRPCTIYFCNIINLSQWSNFVEETMASVIEWSLIFAIIFVIAIVVTVAGWAADK